MITKTKKKLTVLLTAIILSAPAYAAESTTDMVADPTLPPLPIEETGNVLTLPKVFPDSWVYVDEASFMTMFGGKVILMDTNEENPNKQIKAITDKALLGGFLAPKTRDEFYIIESFHERGSRGAKKDYLVIYDKFTNKPIKEMLWPETRLNALPRKAAMAISPDEKLLYVANFSPAASFTVVDLDTREIVDTVGTPGCVLTFATGKRSITSMCSNGGLLTSELNKDGTLKKQHKVAPFFDTDKTPVFERPTVIDGIAYFASFEGEMHEVDLSGNVAKYVRKWSMITEDEKAQNWRPGGLALNDSDDDGRYYVIMHPDGFDGSQTHGGPQVWIYDLKTKKPVKKIDIPAWAVSITVTRGDKPNLVVTNGELNLDIYDPESGKLLRTLSDFGNITPLVVHKAY